MSVSHPSSTRPFFIFKPRHHAFPNASSSKRKIALLPNDDILPTADTFTECFEENLLPKGAFSTKLGPQVSLFPVPYFGVNNLRRFGVMNLRRSRFMNLQRIGILNL
jgi:hypothetical protein